MKKEPTILGFPLKVKISDLLPPFSGAVFSKGAKVGSIITMTFNLYWKVSKDGKSLTQVKQILTPNRIYYKPYKPSDVEKALKEK